MTINYDKLGSTQFEFPTKKMAVPGLKDFFEEGEKPEWEYRGLNGTELALVNNVMQTNAWAESIKKAVYSMDTKGLTKSLDGLQGKDLEEVPPDLAKRLKILELGSVPPCPEHVCVRLAHTKPNLVWNITGKIMALTDDGADLGK